MTNPVPPPVEYRLRRMLEQGEWVVSVEVDPPHGLLAEAGCAAARTLRAAGADCIDAGDSPMASVRMSPIAFSAAVQQRTGVEAVIHFTSRDRNLMALQSDLLGAHLLGIRSVIALSGDPPSLGRYAHATAVWDVKADGLVEIIAGLNAGVDTAGNDLGGRTDFTIAAAATPNADDLDAEVQRMEAKAGRGAHCFFTQVTFDAERTLRFLEAARRVARPVVVGLMPLISDRNARYMATNVPGVVVPDSVIDRMTQAADPVAEGQAITREIAEAIRPSCAGVYLTGSGNMAAVAPLVAALKGRA